MTTCRLPVRIWSWPWTPQNKEMQTRRPLWKVDLFYHASCCAYDRVHDVMVDPTPEAREQHSIEIVQEQMPHVSATRVREALQVVQWDIVYAIMALSGDLVSLHS